MGYEGGEAGTMALGELSSVSIISMCGGGEVKRVMVFQVADPEQVVFEMTIKMNLRDWKSVREQLESAERLLSLGSPLGHMSQKIGEMIERAASTWWGLDFYNGEEE
jgi:hypothetical protein